MITPGSDILEVAVGVIPDTSGRILIAQRHLHLHQGGLWEFPGGKIEAGESPAQALRRELWEELAIEVECCSPLITLRYDYPECKVRLHVRRVEAFSGDPRGVQGQPFRWVEPELLPDYPFPAANAPIVTAVRLPDRYGMIDPPSSDPEHHRRHLIALADRGIRLIRLRASRLAADVYASFAREAADFCHARQMILLLNHRPGPFEPIRAGGLHLRSDQLMSLSERPVGRDAWLAASCHGDAQLRQAERIGVDFAVLGPVKRTATHPSMPEMGWSAFASHTEKAIIPLFALGGLNADDLVIARQHGAQGVAAIRGLLE
jgi:8-oxo-dGTP diphosphatase